MAFPARPGILGINRAHPANRNLLYSFVGVPAQRTAYDFLKRQIHAIGTTVPSYTNALLIGNSATFASASGDSYSIANRLIGTNPVGTIGTILVFNTLAANNAIFGNSTGTNGLFLILDTATTATIQFRAVANANSNVTVATGIPYLLVGSCSGNSGTINLILVRLDTGAITTTATTITGSIKGPTNGTYILGNNESNIRGAGASIAACLYSPIFMPMDALRQWARDPWRPWRDMADDTVITLLQKATGAIIPWPFFNMRAA